MALPQQRTRVNRENIPVLLNGKKNEAKVLSAAPRLGLSTRNANVAPAPVGLKAKRQILLEGPSVPSLKPKAPVVSGPGSLPIKLLPLPPNVEDIDEDDVDHLEFSAVYVKEIYEYLFRIETLAAVEPKYLNKHPTLRPHMRMILIEWLVSLQARFKLLQETLLMTVSILDRFMSETTIEINRGKFQLVGVVCMLVACKFEEIYLPSVSDFAYMCDGAYTTENILAMERQVLNTLKFDFAKPLSAHFLRRFSKAGGADSLTHTVAKYFLELAIYDYDLVHCCPSAVAASALFVAGKLTDVVCWNETVRFYSRYAPEDLEFIIAKLAELGATAPSNKFLKTTYKKYAADKFQRVAKKVGQSEDVLRTMMKKTSDEPETIG